MAGYTRTDTTNNIATGNVINASDLDNEYDAIQAAYNETTGHTHGGAAGEGAPITRVGPVQDVVVSGTAVTPKTDNTMDLGSAALEFKDLYIDGTANIDSLVADTADINGGTVDGAVIGGATAAAGTFTTATATTGNITTVNATTVNTTNLDLTNLEVTNIKAKDGTASATIADTTGVMTVASVVLTTADINGGTIDATAIGAGTASTGAFTTLNSNSTTTLNGTTIPASKTLVVTTDIGSTVQAYDADLAAFALKTAPTGAVVGTTDTQTLTNKTVALGSNTVSGTLAQFNTAVTDADLASIAGAETLTNKTISADNNTLSGIAASSFVLSNASGNIDGAAAQKAIPAGVVVGTTDTQTLTNKTVALGSNTVSGTLAQFNTAVTDADFASIAGTETLTNKTIDGASNTLTNLPLANITEPVRHSVRPSLLLDFANTKTLDPRITFTRASTGTFYDGKTVAKAEENLFPRSQEFDNAGWAKSNVTVTANGAVAPDGTTTAESVTVSSATNALQTQGSFNIPCLPSTTYTVSVFMRVTTGTASGSFQVAELPSYAGANVTANLTTTWTRYTNTYTTTSGATNLFTGFSNFTNGAVYEIWGLQVEQRSSVTAYTATTTAPITNYIPALQSAASGVARFEHNPITGESLGLEIEEQRTNLLTYSSAFNDASWTKANSTITTAANIAPDGTQTAQQFVPNNGATLGAGTAVYKQITLAAGAYTISVYAKANQLSSFTLQNGSGDGGDFNLSTVTATVRGSSVSTITAVGNGWYRCITTIPSGVANPFFYLYPNAGTTNGFNSIYIWGAQLEAGAFATSYIPTVASQVTRSADAASMTGTNFSSWYRADEGTIYGESLALGSSASTAALVLSGTDNSIVIGTGKAAFDSRMDGRTNGVVQFAIADFRTKSTYTKVAGSIMVNNALCAVDGASAGSDTSVIVPSINQLSIGTNRFLTPQNVYIKKLAYYPKALTSAELVGLTTV